MRDKIIPVLIVFNIVTCFFSIVATVCVSFGFYLIIVAKPRIVCTCTSEDGFGAFVKKDSGESIVSILPSGFGKLTTVQAKVVFMKNKRRNVRLEIESCNGIALQKVACLDIDKLSHCEDFTRHGGEVLELYGYESIEVGGVPNELLQSSRIQECSYYIKPTFVVLRIRETKGRQL